MAYVILGARITKRQEKFLKKTFFELKIHFL